MEHEHGGAAGRRAGKAGAAPSAPAKHRARLAPQPMALRPERWVAAGGRFGSLPPGAATAPAGAGLDEGALVGALARALDAGGLDKLIEWLFALDAQRLAGAVVDTLRDSGELPATLARLDAGELDAGAVVDRVAFGSLSRLYALADRALGPHSDGCGDD